MMEIRNIPISHDGNMSSSPQHRKSYALYQTEKPLLKATPSAYPTALTVAPNAIHSKYVQKQRLDTLFKHEVMSIIIITDGKLWHEKQCFQIEAFQHQERYLLWCVTLDDYYLQQSAISSSIHDRYAKFAEFVSKNLSTQLDYLSSVLKNEKVLQDMVSTFLKKEQKFAHQFHSASTMLDRSLRVRLGSTPTNAVEVQYKVIWVLYKLFRKHSDFLLENEDIYFSLLYHIQGIKGLLDLS
jgi:hypothetical protein